MLFILSLLCALLVQMLGASPAVDSKPRPQIIQYNFDTANLPNSYKYQYQGYQNRKVPETWVTLCRKGHNTTKITDYSLALKENLSESIPSRFLVDVNNVPLAENYAAD